MTLRERQTELTRTAIIDAATELLFGSGTPENFTMQAVADAAGVSHRTLYRHFPSRQELIDAVGATIDARLSPGFSDPPPTFDAWLASIPAVVVFARTHADTIRRGFLLGFGLGEWRTDRDAHYWRLFRQRFPHLSEEVARQDYAALRHLYSAAASLELGERFCLDGPGVTEALERSVRALVADIDRRDREAAKGNAGQP